MTTATKSKTQQQFTDRVEFDSSVVHEAFYDRPSQRLFVTLRSGRVCGYEGVGPDVWNDFATAGSAGRFWNWQIKRGSYKKLSGDVDFVEAATPASDFDQYLADNPNLFVPSVTPVDFSKQDFTNINLPTANRVFLVTVEVEAPNLTVAVNDVVSQGLEVVAVRPA